MESVKDEEQVARAIFSPSFLNPDKSIGPYAYYMVVMPSGSVESNISIFRMKLCDDIYATISSLHPRTPGDVVCGYGKLSVGDIRGIQIPDSSGNVRVDVKAFPSKKYPSHAGVVIEMDERQINAYDFYNPNSEPLESINPHLLFVVRELADQSIFEPLLDGYENQNLA